MHDQGSSRAAIQLKIDKLGAVYTSLGQVTADVKAATSEVASLKEMMKTSEFADHIEEYSLGPKEEELAALTASQDQYVADIERMRNGFAEETMPAAKEGEKRYNAVFAEQVAMPDGAAALASIVATVSGLRKELPAAPTDGTKAARQPPGKPVEALQREGVKEAATMFAAVMAALMAAGMGDGAAGSELDGSSVCPVEKQAGRAFEKVYSRWGGDFRAVTDWGRATVCGQTLAALARAIGIATETLTGLGYVVVAVKSSMDLEKNVAASGGYRNVMLNLKCPSTGHVVELQFALSPIEAVKHGPVMLRFRSISLVSHPLFLVARALWQIALRPLGGSTSSLRSATVPSVVRCVTMSGD